MFAWALKKILGTKHQREIKKLQPKVEAINALEDRMRKLSDAELQAKTGEFREKLDKGASLDDILIPAFATVREAGRRVLKMRHYDVQLIGGMVLHEGRVAEMRTGEGKTLVSTLPCYLNALSGKGVHVVTVNDYLARRDAEWMGQVHNFLGLSVGVVVPQTPNRLKKRAYAADITYGQNNEFGFDYLRDNMKFSIYDYAQRELNYAIIDEVDSILIDEARTPLIISGPGTSASDKYQRITELIPKLRRDEHYEVDEKARQVALTEEGMEYAQQLLNREGLLAAGDEGSYRDAPRGNLYDPVNLESLHILQQCLRAHSLYLRDKHYMVSPDGKVMIIDEAKGRALPGRRWSDGLHQAVEAKERVPIQDENVTLATISFQNLFRLYDKLSGMTGTADTEATEFHKIYELEVVVIPTNKPVIRKDDDDLVYKSEREKFRAVVADVEERVAEGRPVLVGTTSVEKSDAISGALEKKGIDHEVLNAKQHTREAYIVAQAGRPGAVTVATNMAGRGTDIHLGGNAEMVAEMELMATADEELKADPEAFQAAVKERADELDPEFEAAGEAIKKAGGLHIIGTERHESRRVDNQLRGRAGRQGDPGSSRFYLSLEDDLMRIFAGDRVSTMMDRLGMEEDVPIEHKWVTKAVENAQKKVEERNFDIRKNMLEYDDVMNQQRKSVYTLRKQVLRGQYRTVPTEDEAKAGQTPEPMVNDVDEALLKRAKPLVEQMVKLWSSDAPPEGASPEEIQAIRDEALAKDIGDLESIRVAGLERDIYGWFGCPVDLEPYEDDPKGAFKHLVEEVGMSLTEQKERLLDIVDELVGRMVERRCPPDKHYEDWQLVELEDDFEESFDIDCPDLSKYGDPQSIAEKLYDDAEGLLFKKMKEFGPEYFLRLFRNAYLQEIDKRWIENLQSMEHLRDGIGLRGYGQRDPKKEYKREGFDLFEEMMASIKASVARYCYTVRRVREEDLRRLEAERKKAVEQRQKQMQTGQAGKPEPSQGGDGVPRRRAARPAAGGGPRRPGGGAGKPQPQAMNRRERRAQAKRERAKRKSAQTG